jgi:hypothetical protein
MRIEIATLQSFRSREISCSQLGVSRIQWLVAK